MATRSIIRNLEMKLSEAFFVFWHLPKQLTTAAKRIGIQRLRDDVLSRASALRVRGAELLAALANWSGRKPEPCDCADLAAELNEMRYITRSPAPDRWMYDSVMRLSTKLLGMVQERLAHARRLAMLVGERMLAADIAALTHEVQQGTKGQPQGNGGDGAGPGTP